MTSGTAVYGSIDDVIVEDTPKNTPDFVKQRV